MVPILYEWNLRYVENINLDFKQMIYERFF